MSVILFLEYRILTEAGRGISEDTAELQGHFLQTAFWEWGTLE